MYSAFWHLIFIGLITITPVSWAVSLQDIQQKWLSSTIFLSIETESEKGIIETSSGSGFVVSKNLVLTAKHVVPDLPKGSKRSQKITGTSQNWVGSSKHEMEVIARDPNFDFAILQFKDTSVSLPSVNFGDPSQISSTNFTLITLGSHFDTGFNSAIRIETGGPGESWITNIYINSGDSGGAIFNDQGQVVAMVASPLEGAEGLNYLLPINFANNLLSQFGIKIPEAPHNPSVQDPVKTGNPASPVVVQPTVSQGIVLKPVKVESSKYSPFQDCLYCPEMVVIPGGEFEMGSNNEGYPDQRPVHKVRVSTFALGKIEITQGQWHALMGSNPSRFRSCGDDCPVERVSWNDAQAFIQKLNGKTGNQYRLPSEAEWEYACRAGMQQKYCGSDDVDSVAWYEKNSDSKSHSVGRKQPNAFGLYDMSGNVWEFVEDGYNNDYYGAPVDGSVWQGDDDSRVLRGGSNHSGQHEVYATTRVSVDPAIRSYRFGFRVARKLP